MNKVIQGWSITCPKCGTVNAIVKEDLKYPARSIEVLYCAKCNEILGHKNSTVSLDTKIVTDNK